MAEIRYPHFDQHHSKYIFKVGMSHNLQRAEENGNNVKFYRINFITSLLFLCKQFYNQKLIVIIIISSLLHLTIAYNALRVSFNCVSLIVNLKNSPTNEFLTIEVLHITYKINPLLHNVVKWSDTLLKSCSKCCKICKVCLTILRHCEVKG